MPGFADLVCYWFYKAGHLVADGTIARAGLVATNSIRGGRNRAVLDGIVEDGAIFDAWSDEPWVVEGAAVRVSLICLAGHDAGLPVKLNGMDAGKIAADLTAGTVDLTKANTLSQSLNTAFVGDQKSGPFEVPGAIARDWLCLPANPNGRPNSDVLKPWMNAMDLTRRPAAKWIIDFGDKMTEAQAALYEAPFARAKQNVWPMRQRSKVEGIRDFWWRHWRPRPAMWRALRGLSRYIATPAVAKHRLFVWLDSRICPDHALIVVARDDDTTFGMLHSRFHEAWSIRLGTSLGKGNDPRYTPTTTFETFPFPMGLSPDVPAGEYADDPRAIGIAEAARRLVELRDRWLNPPEWVAWVDEPVSRLSQAPRTPRRGHRQGAQETHPHQPLQRPAPMAGRRPRHPRRRRSRSLRLAGRHLPRRRPPGVADAESGERTLITKDRGRRCSLCSVDSKRCGQVSCEHPTGLS